MLFNSLTFWIFFVLVYAGYRVLDTKGQNRWLLLASYIFYGAWDWRFLSLIFASTVLDYAIARWLVRTDKEPARKGLVFLSAAGNLGILGFFKYFNFFADSAAGLLSLAGFYPDRITLEVILPVGISFYTFQTLSYTVDVYRRKMEPVRDFGNFALFVAFFPQLVAGPIERAERLVPQIALPRTLTWDKTASGFRLVVWGLFKKIVIADNMARVADLVFYPGATPSGLWVLAGTYAFALQIYGDFSGYSDMARGIARILGFELSVNFKSPYLATNPSDFWNRWHITLSSWLRDYLYIPLGGNRRGTGRTLGNLMTTMILGGLWHGASVMFILWGAYHGLLLAVYHTWNNFHGKMRTPPRGWGRAVRILLMFHLTCIGWIFFRAVSLEQGMAMFRALVLDLSLMPLISVVTYSGITLVLTAAGIGLLIFYAARLDSAFGNAADVHSPRPPVPDYGNPAWNDRWQKWPLPLKWLAGAGVIVLFVFGAVLEANQFIYFQF